MKSTALTKSLLLGRSLRFRFQCFSFIQAPLFPSHCSFNELLSQRLRRLVGRPINAETLILLTLSVGLVACSGPRGVEPVPPTLAQMKQARGDNHNPTRVIVDRSEMPRSTNFIHNSTQLNQTQVNQTQVNQTQFNIR